MKSIPILFFLLFTLIFNTSTVYCVIPGQVEQDFKDPVPLKSIPLLRSAIIPVAISAASTALFFGSITIIATMGFRDYRYSLTTPLAGGRPIAIGLTVLLIASGIASAVSAVIACKQAKNVIIALQELQQRRTNKNSILK